MASSSSGAICSQLESYSLGLFGRFICIASCSRRWRRSSVRTALLAAKRVVRYSPPDKTVPEGKAAAGALQIITAQSRGERSE